MSIINPIGHQERYFREEFDQPPRVSRWFWILVAVLTLAVSHLAAASIGGWMAVDHAREVAAGMLVARKVVPAVNPPPPLIKCDKQGREEFYRVCRARMRSTEIGK